MTEYIKITWQKLAIIIAVASISTVILVYSGAYFEHKKSRILDDIEAVVDVAPIEA